MEDNRDAHAASSKSCDESSPRLSLKEAMRRYERQFIERALREAEGSITRAARLLGTNHQTLAFILKTRQRELLSLRTPAVSRRRSIIKRR